ncbi:MAG: hypothetical protein OHK0028_08050 [Deltaproteobacteria bacterium]
MYASFMQYGEVLVTGGTGLAGPPVCRALIGRGVLPRLLVRLGSEGKIPPEVRGRCRVTPGDLAVREFAENAAQGTSAVVHLAGSWKESPKEGVSFREAIVHATDNAIHAAREWGIPRMIFLGVSGAKAGNSVSFLDAKGRAEEHVRNSGLSWTVFRAAPFYDLRDGTVCVAAGYLEDLAAAIADSLFRDDTIGRVYEPPATERFPWEPSAAPSVGESGFGHSPARATR